MNNVLIAGRKNMEVQLVMSVDMNKTKKEKILIKLYAKIAMHLMTITKSKNINTLTNISLLFYLQKANVIIVNMIYPMNV